MIIRLICSLALIPVISGCSGVITMMPRDSGKTYSGRILNAGFGSADIEIDIDGALCKGKVVKVTSNESFSSSMGSGAVSANGNHVAINTNSVQFGTSGTATLKSILSCTNGHGLRCDFTSNGNGGGGVCFDDNQKAYDAIVTM